MPPPLALDHRDESDRERAAEHLTEEKYEAFVQRSFPNADKLSEKERTMLWMMRQDRMLTTNKAFNLDAQSQYDQNNQRRLYDLLNQSQEQVQQLLALNDELQKELKGHQDFIDDIKGKN